MDLGLKDRVALVTGGAAGIGAAIAAALMHEGCVVWIADRDEVEARRTAADCTARGLHAHAIGVDVTRPDMVRDAVGRVLAESGRLDILVCNAGVLASGDFLESTAEEWDRVLAVNLSGVVTCVRAALVPMLAQGRGRIVNIASISAMRGGGSIGNILYGTTKAGVVALTMGLARELGPRGITVNAIAPAVADTPMTRAALTDAMREAIARRIPLGRLASLADIADAVTFLASERAGFITGVVLPVDGGILTT